MIRYRDDVWFAVVSASPSPESGESVNVGLLVGHGSYANLEKVPGLPRLACLTSTDQVRLIERVMSGIAREVSAETLPYLRASLGPHFKISDPRALYRADKEGIARLKEYYLGAPGAYVKRTSEAARVKERSLLDQYLRRAIPGFGIRVEKRVTPKKLYPNLDPALFGTPVPAIDRALRSADRDVLMSGIAIGSPQTIERVRSKTVKVSQAFWQYGKLQDRIRESTGREFRRVSVIMRQREDRQTREAEEFIDHLLSTDSDHIVRLSELQDASHLQSEVNWLLKG